MFAIGRSANTKGLGLESAGVALGKGGEVIVDKDQRTNVASIYAVGDVSDRVNLTPVAIREGHAFADTVFGGKPRAVDHDWIPTAVFSTPEIGTVGLPEHEAAKRPGGIDIYKARFRPMKMTLAGRDEKMLMKLIVERATRPRARLPCARHRWRRDRPDGRDRHAHGRDQGRFRRDDGAPSERGGGAGNHAREMDAARAGRGVACGPVEAASAGGGENPWRHDEA